VENGWVCTTATAPSVCTCELGRGGPDCQCTRQDCGGNGYCNAEAKCLCDVGFTGDKCGDVVPPVSSTQQVVDTEFQDAVISLGGDDDIDVDPNTNTTVSPAPPRAFLELSVGALTETTTITMDEFNPEALVEDLSDDGGTLLGTLIDLGPDGLEFAQPVTLSLAIPSNFTLPPGEVVGVYVFQTLTRTWEAVEGAVYDEAAGVCTATLAHFSVYAVRLAPPRPTATTTTTTSPRKPSSDDGDAVDVRLIAGASAGAFALIALSALGVWYLVISPRRRGLPPRWRRNIQRRDASLLIDDHDEELVQRAGRPDVDGDSQHDVDLEGQAMRLHMSRLPKEEQGEHYRVGEVVNVVEVNPVGLVDEDPHAGFADVGSDDPDRPDLCVC